MKIFLVLMALLFQFALGANFGEYRYSKYNAINAQLQARRTQALRQQQLKNVSATRNIRYPDSSNPYPNIQRSQNYPLTRNQRYSSAYYNRYSNSF